MITACSFVYLQSYPGQGVVTTKMLDINKRVVEGMCSTSMLRM